MYCQLQNKMLVIWDFEQCLIHCIICNDRGVYLFAWGNGNMYSPLKPRGNSLPHHLNDGPLRHPFKSWHGAGQEENVTLDLASTKRIKVLLRFSISLFASSVSWCQ